MLVRLVRVEQFDAIVLGLGVMGAATLRELSARGLRALGIDRHGIAHDRGSSHGEQRLIRTAYFEHPAYVPLAQRAIVRWEEIELAARVPLLKRCGLVIVGEPQGPVLSGIRRASEEHALRLETLTPSGLEHRWPCFHVEDRLEVLHEPDAGVLFAEACVQALAEQAVSSGAQIRAPEIVQDWSPEKGAAGANSVVVRTDRDVYHAARLVICGGPWSVSLLRALDLPLVVRRKVMLWVSPVPECLYLDRGGPVFAYDLAGEFYYGFPSLDGQSAKVGIHTGGSNVTAPEDLDRRLNDGDVTPIRSFLSRHMRGLGNDVQRHSVCMYTMTPDEHFILDRLPGLPEVVIGAGFSGHGFKFAPVIGTILADLAINGGSELIPPGLFSIDRLDGGLG